MFCSVMSQLLSLKTTAEFVFVKGCSQECWNRPYQSAHLGGISAWGATQLVIFSGFMNAKRLGAVYEAGLLPFIEKHLINHHRLYQDSDPKHSSKYIEHFLSRSLPLTYITCKPFFVNNCTLSSIKDAKRDIPTMVFTSSSNVLFCYFVEVMMLFPLPVGSNTKTSLP